MPFIEIITDTKSQIQLNKSICKEAVNDCEILYIKEKNIENIKNIKFETVVLDQKIENEKVLEKVLKNSKNIILNKDFNNEIDEKIVNNKITYGYNSKSDITISSVQEEQVLVCIQNTIISLFGKKIEPQEIKVNIKSDISVYNIMVIIALTTLYAR